MRKVELKGEYWILTSDSIGVGDSSEKIEVNTLLPNVLLKEMEAEANNYIRRTGKRPITALVHAHEYVQRILINTMTHELERLKAEEAAREFGGAKWSG
jgi:hypothetical protein